MCTVCCIDVQADSTASKSLHAGTRTLIQDLATILSWQRWSGLPAMQCAGPTSQNDYVDNATAVIICRLRTAYLCTEPW